MSTQPDTRMVAVDGTDALAYVIIRPGKDNQNVVIESGAHGITKAQAAYALRHIADQFEADESTTDESADSADWLPNGGHTDPMCAYVAGISRRCTCA
nr:hypothetical protein KPHV_60320 [Kitasatospora purpeofusca]